MITADRLRQVFSYDPDTGVFIRILKTTNAVKVGDIGGSPSNSGHLSIMIDGRLYKAHRLAWLYMTGAWPENQIDHRDVDPANNKWNNLREADYSGNARNRGATKRNSTGLKGVHFHKREKRWSASIRYDGQPHWLGFYETAELAHDAYSRAAKEFHGEFARVA